MIWDKAQDLGRLIGQSAEYQALRRAETSLREDKETVAKLDQIQTLARKVDQAVVHWSDARSGNRRGVRDRGARPRDESHRAGIRRGTLELREADAEGESANQ